MYKNEKFSFKLMISVNGFTEKPTSKDNYSNFFFFKGYFVVVFITIEQPKLIRNIRV